MPKTEKNKNAQCVSDLESRALATTYTERSVEFGHVKVAVHRNVTIAAELGQ